MRRPRRMRGLGSIGLLGVALLTTGAVGATLALYDASTQNAATTFSGGWVGAPSGVTATPEGNDVTLKWTAGTQQVTGQKLFGEDKGTSESCTSMPKAELTETLASATTTSFKDEGASKTGRGTEANAGNWFCYELQSTSATKWTAQTFDAVQLGMVASGVSTANAASKCTKAPTPEGNQIDCKDTITITFNQKTTLAAKSIVVCVFASEKLIVIGEGSTGATKCGANPSGSYALGELVVAGAKVKTNLKFEKSPYTLSTSAPWTATITLEGAIVTSLVEKEGTSTPTWTFIPPPAIKSSISTHQATICTAEKSTCRPTTTSDF